MVLLRYDADKLAKECKMKLYRTSVKEDLNVAVVFQHLAENYVNKVRGHFLLSEIPTLDTFLACFQTVILLASQEIELTPINYKSVSQNKIHFNHNCQI